MKQKIFVSLNTTLVVGLYALIFVSQLCSFALSYEQVASSMVHSQQHNTEKEDVICTELTSKMITLEEGASKDSSLDDRERTAYVCDNFGNEFSKELFYMMVWGSCGDRHGAVCYVYEEKLAKWYMYCLKTPGSNVSKAAKCTSAPSTKCSRMNLGNCARRSTRYVDFLFLLEQPNAIDVNISHQLSFALRSLAKALNTNTIDSRFAFALYSLGGEDYARVSDFSPMIPKAFEEIPKFNIGSIRSTEQRINRRLLHHESVSENLKQVSRFLNLRLEGEEAEMLSIKGELPVTVSYRNYADLHILSFLDLSGSNIAAHNDDKHKIERLVDRAKESIDEQITRILDDLQLSLISDHPTSLHFFFNGSNFVAKSSLGDPKYSVRYSDCTHFNKAMTLKVLLSSNHKDQADTLQAHMLSQGVEMQVHTLNDLRKKNCIFGVTPILSTPSGLQYKFTNICQECNVSSIGSHNGCYCSPLHGWTKKIATRQKKSELFEGKAPLSSQFLASHADLLKPASTGSQTDNDTTDNLKLPLVTLSISQELDSSKKYRFEPIIEGHPRILQWSPDKPFIEKMLSKGKPTVLKNTVVQTWPALKKWTLSYLEKNMGMDILPSVKCTNSFLTFDPDQRTPLKLNISLPFTPVNMTTQSFFKCIRQDPSNPTKCSDGYEGHYYFGSVPDTLKQDVMPDKFLYHTEKDYKAKKQFMWISSAGMITHTHFDQDFNFFVQLVGKKRFTLWSPEQHELMYVYPRVHPMWHKSRVNYRAVDLDRFPAFSLARGKQIELGSGDMLFVPPYTWHYVETLTPSVSLSTWSHDYDLYNHMNSIYRHDHKFDLLEDPRGE